MSFCVCSTGNMFLTFNIQSSWAVLRYLVKSGVQVVHPWHSSALKLV